MKSEGWGILQWQLVLERTGSEEISLQVRLLRASVVDVPEEGIVRRLRKFFVVFPMTEQLFSIRFLGNMAALERRSTGAKVINFADRTKD